MKKLFVILLVLATIFACTSKEEEKKALITGKIENPDNDIFEIAYAKDFITFEQEKHEVTLDENNKFAVELAIESIVNAQIFFEDQQKVSIFIEPHDKLHITLDKNDITNTISFSGDNADNNTFFHKYKNQIKEKYGEQEVYDKMRNLKPEKFLDFANKMLDTKQQFFNDLSKEKNFSDNFKHLFETDIKFGYYDYLLNYPEYHQVVNNMEDEPELPADYYAFTEDNLNFSDNNLVSPNYCKFLESYLEYYKKENPHKIPEDKSHVEKNLFISEKIYDGKTLEHIKTVNIKREFDLGDFDVAKKAYKSFLNTEPDKRYRNILTDVYELEKRLLPGNTAPNFELRDIDNNKVSLEDFRGKVVYLDFWASWCPPCMREVPYAKELKERFEDKEDLVFVYISVDEDTEAWKNTVEQREIEGVHLNIKGRDNEVAKSYNVTGIPSYFIIDRKGLIFDNNAKRPSHDGIDEDLKAALKKYV